MFRGLLVVSFCFSSGVLKLLRSHPAVIIRDNRRPIVPYLDVIWTEHNIEHLAANGITPKEAEEVLANPVETGMTRKTRRPIAFGFRGAAGSWPLCMSRWMR